MQSGLARREEARILPVVSRARPRLPVPKGPEGLLRGLPSRPSFASDGITRIICQEDSGNALKKKKKEL